MRGVKNKRKNTRSAVWEDITATLDVSDPSATKGRGKMIVKGRVKDIGAQGMFFVSADVVPMDAKADIVIDFNPEQPGNLILAAEGKTIRKDAEGVGIRFTRIDLRRLQQCITARMNRS